MQYSGRDFQRFDAGDVQRLRDEDAETERHFVFYFKELLRGDRDTHNSHHPGRVAGLF